jgi:hypothetical protein
VCTLGIVKPLPIRKGRVVAAVCAVVLCAAALVTQLSPARADTVTADATADTYTRASADTSNFGTRARWSVDGQTSGLRYGFLRFEVSVPTGETVTSATLRAYSESASSATGVDVHTTSGGWTETGLTWDNQPAPGSWLSNAGGFPRAAWVEWDVTAGVPADGGEVNLELTTSEQQWLGFDSRESSSGRAPQLVVTTASTPSPTTTTTSSPSPTTTTSSPSPTTTTSSPSPTATTSSPSPTATTSSPSPTPTGGDITLAAVGDINGSGVTSTTGASGLNAASILAANPAAVLTLGDHQYDYGSCSTLVSQWDVTGWGALLPKIISAAGPTHDWSSASDTANYRDHLAGTCAGQTSGKSLADTATGTSVGPDTNYAVDLGAWRVISLSSGLWRYDTTEADAATTWLDNALTASDAAGDHTVVIWHEPYWTSTTAEHTPTTAVKPWIDLLWKHHVDLLVNGHQHGYARFYPQDNTGARDDASGIQEFIVGTGGIGFYPWSDTAPNVAVQQTGTYGWLKLTLHPDGHYAYQFVPTSGGTFTDSGTR